MGKLMMEIQDGHSPSGLQADFHRFETHLIANNPV